MSDWSDTYWKMIERLRTVRSVDELTLTLSDAEKFVDWGDLRPVELLRITNAAAEQLMNETSLDVDKAIEFITFKLIPVLLTNDSSSSIDEKVAAKRGREILREWIEQYPEQQQSALRVSVIEELQSCLDTHMAESACWVLMEIGYREDGVVNQLIKKASVLDEPGCAALTAIASMAPSDETRSVLLKQIAVLIRERRFDKARAPLYYLADYGTLELAEELVASIDPGDFAQLGSLGCLVRIADLYADDEALQDRVWSSISRFTKYIKMDSGLASRCNSACVLPELFGKPSSEDRKEGSAHWTWFVKHRVEECVRPLHLESWQRVREIEGLVGELSAVARSNTGSKSQWVTAQSQAKEYAWDLALSMGVLDVVEWLNEAIADEDSPYVQRSIMEAAACLAFPDIPPIVAELVTKEHDCKANEVGELVSRLGALDIVNSAGSEESLCILLHSGVTHDGNVLLSFADAAASVAYWLVTTGNEPAVELIFDAMDPRRPSRHREVAARAIRVLGSNGFLTAVDAKQFQNWIADKSLATYSRGDLIRGLNSTGNQLDDTLLKEIAELLETEEENEALWEAILLLIGRQDWHRWSPQIWNRLGWDASGNFDPDKKLAVNGWRSWVIGELYKKDTERFERSLVYVIQNCDAHSCYQLARCIKGKETSKNVANSIFKRLSEVVTPHYSEDHMFSMLAGAAPTSFIEADWWTLWQHWNPGSKIAFLHTLQELFTRVESGLGKAVGLVTQAMLDSTKSVRVAAYEALFAIDPEAVFALGRQWARSAYMNLRLNAAELVRCLPYKQLSSERFVSKLRSDPSRLVRETVTAGVDVARNNHWIEMYMERVTAIKSPDIEKMLAAYPYGQALVQLGDDRLLLRLQEYIGSNLLPPNVYNWLRTICDKLDKKVSKLNTTTESQAWYGWDSIKEEFDGYIKTEGNRCSARLKLWRQPAVSPSEPGIWNGVADAPGFGLSGFFAHSGECRIGGENRNEATAILSSYVKNEVIILTGSGPYPEPH